MREAVVRPYIEQSLKSLRLCLAPAAISAEGFSVVAENTVRFGSVEVRLAILAESHLVVFSQESKVIGSELLACTESATALPKPAQPLERLPARLTERFGPFDYEFRHRIRVERIDPSAFLKGPADLVLAVDFAGACTASDRDSAAGKDAQGSAASLASPSTLPKTELSCRHEPDSGAVLLQTWHWYPNENRGVLTHSRLSPRGVSE